MQKPTNKRAERIKEDTLKHLSEIVWAYLEMREAYKPQRRIKEDTRQELMDRLEKIYLDIPANSFWVRTSTPHLNVGWGRLGTEIYKSLDHVSLMEERIFGAIFTKEELKGREVTSRYHIIEILEELEVYEDIGNVPNSLSEPFLPERQT